MCVYTYREYLQLSPSIRKYKLTVCGLVCCQYFGSWNRQLLVGHVVSHVDLRWSQETCEMYYLEQRVHMQYFRKVCVMEEGAVVV